LNRRIAIGDIHGCYRTLKKLISSQIKPGKDDYIYFVGDLIDRGPKSKDVLDFLIDLKENGFNVFSVKGNHEEMFTRAFNEDDYLCAWFRNGAEETLVSFGVPENLFYTPDALSYVPEKYYNFLNSLPYYYDLKDYIIVHAGMHIDSRDLFSNTHAMLWSRDIMGMHFLQDGISIIHGHTPMPLIALKPEITRKDARIFNIDAGCVYKDLPGYGILVAIDLDSRKLFTQENID
jgi:serine/threonine protein phosphatase 1